jgi:hypothetical protein
MITVPRVDDRFVLRWGLRQICTTLAPPRRAHSSPAHFELLPSLIIKGEMANGSGRRLPSCVNSIGAHPTPVLRKKRRADSAAPVRHAIAHQLRP